MNATVEAILAAHEAHVAAHGPKCGEGRGRLRADDACGFIYRAWVHLGDGRYRKAPLTRKSEVQRAYYARHAEVQRENARKYREEHRELLRANVRAYRAANRDAVRARNREYDAAHREERNRYEKAYREANRERLREYQREYKARKRAEAKA